MRFHTFILLVTLSATFSAEAETFYRITKECKGVPIYTEYDEDAAVEGGTLEVGDVFPLRIEKRATLGLRFGTGIMPVPRDSCQLVPEGEQESARLSYERNCRKYEAILNHVEMRSQLGAKFQRDRKALDVVSESCERSFDFYQETIQEIQDGKKPVQDALPALISKFGDSLKKVQVAQASMQDEMAKDFAQDAIDGLAGVKGAIEAVYESNRQQGINSKRALGKAAISAILGNETGALETFAHALIDENADWEMVKDKHFREDHWENIRIVILQLRRVLGRRIPSRYLTSKEELSGRYEWRLVD